MRATSSSSTRMLGADAVSDPDALRLLPVPGVSLIAAIVLLAAIGEITGFPTPRHLVGYLGLDPRVRQSGSEPAEARPDHQARLRRGAQPARRSGLAGGAQPGAAASLSRTRGGERGTKIATVATVLKLVASLAAAQPRRGLRLHSPRACSARSCAGSSCWRAPHAARGRSPRGRARLKTPAAPSRTRRSPSRPSLPIAGWSPTGGLPPKTQSAGAGVTPGRASQRPSKGEATQQTP